MSKKTTHLYGNTLSYNKMLYTRDQSIRISYSGLINNICVGTEFAY